MTSNNLDIKGNQTTKSRKKKSSKRLLSKSKQEARTSKPETLVAPKNNVQRTPCDIPDCECWIRLKAYCQYFKPSAHDDAPHLDPYENAANDLNDEPAEKVKSGRHILKRMKSIESDMADLWQHFLHFHERGDNKYGNEQCVLRDVCPYIKSQLSTQSDFYYRKGSWNLQQSMHVYFYHTNEYLESRNSSARKHRFVRDRESFRHRVSRPMLDTPQRTRIRPRARPRIRSIRLAESSSLKLAESTSTTAHIDSDLGTFSLENDVDTEDVAMPERGPGFDNQPYSLSTQDMEDDDDDDDEEAQTARQATRLQQDDYYAIEYQSTAETIPMRTLEFGLPFIVEKTEAKWKNPKEEMLKNTFCAIKAKEWNDLLKSCQYYVKKRNAKEIHLKLTEVISLKLYTDFDELQREYRRCYREHQPDRIHRQRQFYHWNALLLSACAKSNDIITSPVYHGVNDAFAVPSYSATYYGPVSTTVNFEIAKQFAGSKGRIYELSPSFGRKGLKVSWLSNFPDEGEVLYMNTSFQILNMYTESIGDKHHSLAMVDQKTYELDQKQAIFEKSILKALQVINTESNVVSFSEMKSADENDNDLAFHQLTDYEQVTILYLLYLQYNFKEWKRFWHHQPRYKRIAFAKYRDQFIVIAKSVIGVKMDRMPILLQHFFYESQKKYKFPFSSGDIEEGLRSVRQQFMPKQPFRFETITRLFPNTKQLLINGDNFDWTLSRLLKFNEKYDIGGVQLQEIIITFAGKYDAEQSLKEAQQRLDKAKAHKNVHKLRKYYGWVFDTPCHLRRIGFEPLPELPFLFVFVENAPSHNQELFYRTYSRQILGRPALLSAKAPEYSATSMMTTQSRHQYDASMSYDGFNDFNPVIPPRNSISMQPRRTSFLDLYNTQRRSISQQRRQSLQKRQSISRRHSISRHMQSHRKLKSKAFAVGTPLDGPTPLPALDELAPDSLQRALSNPYAFATNNPPLSMKTASFASSEGSEGGEGGEDDEKKEVSSRQSTTRQPGFRRMPTAPPTINVTSSLQNPPLQTLPSHEPGMTPNTSSISDEVEGSNPFILTYNPKNCVLSQNIVDKLEYKDKMIQLMHWRYRYANLKKPNDERQHKFIKYCNKVQVLVIDPMTRELGNIFMEIPKDRKPIISFNNIYKIFPNVTDIFLRETQLNPRIALKLQDFMQKNTECKLERLFFCKDENKTLLKKNISGVLGILKPIGFGFKESEQMLVKDLK